MSIEYYYKEYEIDGTTYYISQYADKPYFIKFWEYGYVRENVRIGGMVYPKMCFTISNGLRTRPNLKRLFGG
jgi:hypothetical protein